MGNTALSGTHCPFLGDVLQDIEDKLHDHGPFTQLTSSTVDYRHQGTVQVFHVLREQGLPVAAC